MEPQQESLAVAFQFEGTERVITVALVPGSPKRVPLPIPVTWPDGSQSDSVEIVIDNAAPDGRPMVAHARLD